MKLIKIDGEDFRVLDFSKPGIHAEFYMPAAIGAGYRRMIEKQSATNAIQSGTFQKNFARNLKKRHKPNGLPESDWMEQVQRETIAELVEDFDVNDSPDKDLATLEILLKPAPDSIPVKSWYMYHAEDSEVTEILNFLSGNVPAKTETEVMPTGTGKVTKVKAKAGA